MIRGLLLAAFSVLAVAPPAAAQDLACGGHVIIGSDAPRALDAPPGSYLLPRIDQPSWMTARDSELWDALVYDVYDSTGFISTGKDLEDRQTAVIRDSAARTLDVCIEPADQGYAGERLAPYANADWLEGQIERWTGRSWRGDVSTGDCLRLFGVINVREGDPEKMGEKTLAITHTWRNFGQWSRSEITWNPDNLRRADDFQVEVALAHEIGHALGLWHTEPGTGFIMDAHVPRCARAAMRTCRDAHVPRARPTWPAKESDLSNLAYEVGPNVDYPGLVGATPVPALPFLDSLFRWIIR